MDINKVSAEIEQVKRTLQGELTARGRAIKEQELARLQKQEELFYLRQAVRVDNNTGRDDQ